MKMIPVKIEYHFGTGQHKMMASVEHFEDKRHISFIFDERTVYEKDMPAGDWHTDDACIHECAEEYKSTHNNVFSDLFKRHSDKIHLSKKCIDVKIDTGLLLINANMTIANESYTISMSTESGNDHLEGRFVASSFSEMLEKTRILVSTLEGISGEVTEHITEISDDKIMELIKWDE